MKRITLLVCTLTIVGAMWSCGSKQQTTIEGTVADEQFDGKTAYLYQNGEAVDSTVIADGRFQFSRTVAQPALATVVATGESIRANSDIILENGTVKLDLLADIVGGTPMNDTLQDFLDIDDYADIEDAMRSYEQLYYTTADLAVRVQAERLYDSLEAIGIGRTFERAKTLYLGHKGDALGTFAMTVLAGTDRLTYSEMSTLLEGAGSEVVANKRVQARLAQLKAVEATAVGKHYTDIVGVDGKLSDIIDGRLALVDFYASWCPPCRAEIKDNLVPLWAKYKDKGLVVVGLNVWERGDAAARRAAHEKVMADLGITYPQLVDSTTTATDTYGVRGIPQILLIAADGTIVARDLRGAAIEEAIKANL